MTLLDNRSPLTSLGRHRRRDLRSSFLSPRAALDGATFVLARHFQNRSCFKRASDFPQQNAAARHPAAPARIPSPQSNARHDPKPGRARRRPSAPPGSNALFYIGFVSITLRREGAGSSFQKLLSYQADGIEVHISSPLDSSPRSCRTEEVACWRWSPLLWRFCRCELSHRRLLLCASPRMGDTTWARRRRSRPRRHPCKGDREVRSSRRNWSRSSVRFEPFVQYSYPHASLELQWRRSPCALESSCMLVRLPPWRDVAAERHAPGVPNADRYFLGPLYILPPYPQSCPASCAIDRKLLSSLDIHPPAWVGQTQIFLAGGWGHCPRGQPHSPSVAC